MTCSGARRAMGGRAFLELPERSTSGLRERRHGRRCTLIFLDFRLMSLEGSVISARFLKPTTHCVLVEALRKRAAGHGSRSMPADGSLSCPIDVERSGARLFTSIDPATIESQVMGHEGAGRCHCQPSKCWRHDATDFKHIGETTRAEKAASCLAFDQGIRTSLRQRRLSSRC